MKKRILIVDDSLIVREHLVWSLEQAGYDVVEAEDGRDGLTKAESIADLGLIICDVNMPVMDGLGMLAGLKEKGILDRLPFVMLTSEVQPELMSRAKTLGAKGWMVKPVSSEALVATVKKLVA